MSALVDMCLIYEYTCDETTSSGSSSGSSSSSSSIYRYWRILSLLSRPLPRQLIANVSECSPSR